MVNHRGVGTAVVLTLITCGIYGIYWFVVLTDEVGRLSGDSSFNGFKHLLLTLITCGIWSIVWSYQIGKQVAEAQRANGRISNDNSVLYIILSIFGFSIVTIALVQSDVNQMV
ncbi:DUF4234 domain-containing protein [Marinicrinis sediminis]|uniref:DUF4234 domain-containing protein n=1 Tax=Marinicrinis sediminis TaxID=1652465 RepID=A0ABW5RER8_9BACL